MPASLTIQVRLGFSMGWRIWTPNEVGFYAKTLAHSYFILVILKSKFLRELIWIVNYNLFMGTKKYHVFIEFLRFGMKSKEERCFWKKIIYISMVVRHKRLTKRFFTYKEQRHKILSFRAKLYEVLQQKRERVFCWKNLEIGIFKRIRKDFIKMHKKSINGSTVKVNLKSLVYLKKYKTPKLPLICIRNNVAMWRYLKLSTKRSSLIKRLIKFNCENTIKLFVTKKNNKFTNHNSFFFKSDKKKKNQEFFYKKFFLLKSQSLKTIGVFGKNSIAYLTADTVFSNQAEKAVLEEFRFDPVLIKNKYSFCGGPRKRLSRNLRRAYKGKYIKHIADLVWFWEKLARMMTYYLQTYSLEKKRYL